MIEFRVALAAGTSVRPFATLFSGRARWNALRPLTLSALIAAIFSVRFIFQGHALLIGPAPLAGLAMREAASRPGADAARHWVRKRLSAITIDSVTAAIVPVGRSTPIR